MLTNKSNWGCFLRAYASSSARGSKNKLSIVVKGPAAMICLRFQRRVSMQHYTGCSMITIKLGHS